MQRILVVEPLLYSSKGLPFFCALRCQGLATGLWMSEWSCQLQSLNHFSAANFQAGSEQTYGGLNASYLGGLAGSPSRLIIGTASACGWSLSLAAKGCPAPGTSPAGSKTAQHLRKAGRHEGRKLQISSHFNNFFLSASCSVKGVFPWLQNSRLLTSPANMRTSSVSSASTSSPPAGRANPKSITLTSGDVGWLPSTTTKLPRCRSPCT